MATTAATIRTLVRDRAAVAAGDQGLTDATILGFINSAARTVGLEGDWPWNTATETLATVAGTAFITPNAAWIGTKSLTIGIDGEDLQGFSIEEVDQSPSGSRGRPRIYAVWNDTLVLGPVPDAIYALTHRYYTTEKSDLIASDNVDSPEAFLEGVIEYTTYLSLRHLRRIEEAGAALAAYERWVRRAKDNRLRRRGPYRVRVRPGSAI